MDYRSLWNPQAYQPLRTKWNKALSSSTKAIMRYPPLTTREYKEPLSK
jgi:hypothetical protein